MSKISITRPVTMPDIRRIARYERSPDLGPAVLFFSGGSALNEISRTLKKFTHNSIHMVTPFDSGGSSAVLREAFDMPAIGDIRSRLMALADETISGHPEIVQLFAYRLPKEAKRKDLNALLVDMALGKNPMVNAIKNPMRRLIRRHLEIFLLEMPNDFDLRGASIGNLILAAGYLDNDRRLDQVLFMFSKLVNVQGTVLPIVDNTAHLAATLEDGRTIVGQHKMTGKETAPITSPIAKLSLTPSLDSEKNIRLDLPRKNKKLIMGAELICYPPGSFYSSLCATLMPRGVVTTIAENPCPKAYFPSLGKDPEQLDSPLDQSIFRLITFLKEQSKDRLATERLLNYVFIDSQNGEGLKQSTMAELKAEGVSVIDTRLVTPSSSPYYDPQLLVSALLSLT